MLKTSDAISKCLEIIYQVHRIDPTGIVAASS